MVEVKPFAPGSRDAIDAGCSCPIVNNCYGKGAYFKGDGNPVFWYNEKCPIHGKAESIDPKTVLTEINLK